MSRNYNFCAGPAALPDEVLEQLREEIPDWKGKGLSVMEMSHRSKEFVEIAETAKQDFIDLLEIDKRFDIFHSTSNEIPIQEYELCSSILRKKSGVFMF